MATIRVRGRSAVPDAREIVQRSIERDPSFGRLRDYAFHERAVERMMDSERRVTSTNSEVREVLILFGEPYGRLIEKDGKGLTPEQQRKEQEKLDKFTADRQKESERKRKERLAEMEKRRNDNIPLGRPNEPFDVAALAVFLAGPGARNITGQSFNVGSGERPEQVGGTLRLGQRARLVAEEAEGRLEVQRSRVVRGRCDSLLCERGPDRVRARHRRSRGRRHRHRRSQQHEDHGRHDVEGCADQSGRSR